MLDLAGLLGTACVATTFGIMNTISLPNPYSTLHVAHEKETLFAVRGANFTDVIYAEAEFRGQIPWTLLNLGLISRGVVLPKLAAARKLATEAGDLARVVALDRYRRLIARALSMTGFGLAGDNNYEAYKGSKSF